MGYVKPSTLEKRSTNFGKGERYDFTKDEIRSPSPDSYSPRSDFEFEKHKGISIGKAREQMQIKGQHIGDPAIPGPGAYRIARNILANSHAYSITKDQRLSGEKIKRPVVPGPGTYS